MPKSAITPTAPKISIPLSEVVPNLGTPYKLVFGVLIPVPNDEKAELPHLIPIFHNAIILEVTMWKSRAHGCNDCVTTFQKKSKTYLQSLRCLLAAMFEDNARRALKHRLSLGEMYESAKKYKILKCLDETATVRIEPKTCGTGTREITSFGPVARAAQRMFAKLLRTTYQPQGFQFHHLGSGQKVQLAMNLINQKEYTHVAELDIKAFYPSFSEKELVAALSLPPEATRHIALAKDAPWVYPASPSPSSYITTPSGLPQGSVSSSEIALWCVANLVIEPLEGAEIICHADNFFIFATSQAALDKASKALKSAISGLPGGTFELKTEQSRPTAKGFRMLGCDVFYEKGALVAQPTNLNLQKLDGRFASLEQRTIAKFKEAGKNGSALTRFEAVQMFLRLKSIADGWVNAYAFCENTVSVVEDDLNKSLELTQAVFQITDDQLNLAHDASTVAHYDWYSG